MTAILCRGDALDVLRTMAECSVDAVVCDPPYGLGEHKPATIVKAMTAWCTGDREHVPDGKGFMGRKWDAFVPPPAVWDECLRVLKPGGHMAVFAAPRTMDLMGISIRLAGFEVRDAIGNGLLAWVQGQGFPKGKGQLKPAWEPIIVARKPFAGTVAACVLAHGTGALNVEATRVGVEVRVNAPAGNKPGGAAFNMSIVGMPQGAEAREAQGRWPANVVLTHGPDCAEECAPGCPVAELDAQSGILTTNPGTYRRKREDATGDRSAYKVDPQAGHVTSKGDSGGASRFFPVFRYQAKAPTSERPKIDGKGWPTVKPLALMRWLVRLVTPPGGVVLDPFAGTGPTLQAAELEGFDSIGIELDPFAYALACQRLHLTPGTTSSGRP